jgi:hypothetical protein
MTRKIPPELHQVVLELHGQGQDSEHIAGVLWREHKLEVSSRAVRSLCKRHRDEVADQARGVVREQLRKYILPAAAAMHGVLKRARRLEREARAVRRFDRQLLAQDRQLKAANLILHYVGVDQPEQGANAGAQDARQALLDRFEKLVRDKAAPASTPEPKVH